MSIEALDLLRRNYWRV